MTAVRKDGGQLRLPERVAGQRQPQRRQRLLLQGQMEERRDIAGLERALGSAVAADIGVSHGTTNAWNRAPSPVN